MRKLRYSLISLLAVALFAIFMIVPSSTSGQGKGNEEKFRRAERPVLNEYIVVLNDFAAGPKAIILWSQQSRPTFAPFTADRSNGFTNMLYSVSRSSCLKQPRDV